jgi:hypothetical protein
MKDTMLTSMDATSAAPNESTLNPRKTEPANKNTNALIINKKRPRVSMVSGSVRRTKMGLTKALSIPRIAAAIIALDNPVTLTPGTAYATMRMVMVPIIQLIKMPVISLPPNKESRPDSPFLRLTMDQAVTDDKKKTSIQLPLIIVFLRPVNHLLRLLGT